jgi:hypothetical protein
VRSILGLIEIILGVSREHATRPQRSKNPTTKHHRRTYRIAPIVIEKSPPMQENAGGGEEEDSPSAP